MTQTTTINDRFVEGVSRVAYAEVDITSLENAGAEPWDPTEGTEVNNPNAVTVVSAPGDYNINYDDEGGVFTVKAVADGTDVAAGTAVGVAEVKVEGRR